MISRSRRRVLRRLTVPAMGVLGLTLLFGSLDMRNLALAGAPETPAATVPTDPPAAVIAPFLSEPEAAAAGFLGPDVLGELKPVLPELPDELPLGLASLHEQRTVRRISDGITMTTIRRGNGADGVAHGPWVVRAVTIDPRAAAGRVDVTFGSRVSRTEPTTALARAAKAIIGVNGSYFSPGSRHPGDPRGLTVWNGQVQSEPSGYAAEVSLLVDSVRNTLRMAALRWTGVIRNPDTGAELPLRKVNAAPRAGQLALFTYRFATRTPAGVGTEVLFDSDGCAVRAADRRGTRLAPGQFSVQGRGWLGGHLRRLVSEGCIAVEHTLRDRDGATVDLTDATSVITGRIRLLRDGAMVVPDRNRRLYQRHARTIAGTTWDGKLMLVTIDGGTGRSIGATAKEAARVARALGMRDAVNLDGGGSSTLAVRGKKLNGSTRSERAVSDALVWREDD